MVDYQQGEILKRPRQHFDSISATNMLDVLKSLSGYYCVGRCKLHRNTLWLNVILQMLLVTAAGSTAH